MFRLEILPPLPSASQPSAVSALRDVAPKILHLSLGTCREDADGNRTVALKIGRKEEPSGPFADACVAFGSDKTVSRRHAVIRLVSDGEEADDVRCVLDDLKSSFGTHSEGRGRPPPAGDSATDDDTADEDAGDGSSGAPAPDLKLEGNDNVLLAAAGASDGSSARPVTVRFGKHSRIRISRVPWVFCFTRVDKPVREELALRRLSDGTRFTLKWNLECTHLVAEERLSTSKVLCAYVSGRPVVSPDFVRRIGARRTVRDVIPNVDDFLPPGDPPIEGGDRQPEAGGRVLFGGIELVSLADDETEALAEAAGARILRAWEMSDAKFFGGGWIGSRGDDATKFGFIDASSRKLRKRKEFLFQRDLPSITQKEMAQAVSKLKGFRFKEGGKVVIEDSAERHARESEAKRNDAVHPAVGKSQAVLPSEMMTEPLRESSAYRPDDDAEPARAYDDQTHARDDGGAQARDRTGSRGGKNKTATRNDPDADADADRTPADDGVGGAAPARRGGTRGNATGANDGRARRAADPASRPPRDVRTPAGARDADRTDGWISSCRREAVPPELTGAGSWENRGGEPIAPARGASAAARRPVAVPPRTPRTEDRLPSPDGDGWFRTAGKVRPAYRPSHPDDAPIGYEGAAETEIRPLVNVADRAPPAPLFGRNDDGPNFKRFRKNSICCADSSRDIVRMRVAPPKDSERLRQLEVSQREVDEVERIADSLFHDASVGIGRFLKSGPSATSKRQRRR